MKTSVKNLSRFLIKFVISRTTFLDKNHRNQLIYLDLEEVILSLLHPLYQVPLFITPLFLVHNAYNFVIKKTHVSSVSDFVCILFFGHSEQV